MKKLLLSLVMVCLFFSCDNEGMENDENKVTVTFETFGGTYIAPVKVKIGTPIGNVLPKKDPEKAEHEFEGWYKTVRSGVFSNRVIGYELDPLESDITLYAKLVWYYPFEVSNISHTYSSPILTLTWTNPDDDNFYNTAIDGGSNGIIGGNSFTRIWGIMGEATIRIQCIDKSGNRSKGVYYSCDVGL